MRWLEIIFRNSLGNNGFLVVIYEANFGIAAHRMQGIAGKRTYDRLPEHKVPEREG
jgi:hypothetical protein